MAPAPPPLPAVRREPLLRCPLVVTALGRVLMIPCYGLCAIKASTDLRIFLHHPSDYVTQYVVDLVSLAVALWTLLLLSVLLAWLFFSRRRMFRPLMIYFSLLPPLLFVCIGLHTARFPSHSQHEPPPAAAWIGLGVLSAMVFWPLYYTFSPRVKQVFTR